MEVMTVGEYVSGTSNATSNWNMNRSYFVYADYSWSQYGGRIAHSSAPGSWAITYWHGAGAYESGFRAVQSGVGEKQQTY